MSGKRNTVWLETMIEKLGSPEAVRLHQATIGAKGGRNSTTGGFAWMARVTPDAHRRASAKGGRISRKTK